ncbi:hypothetical protein [uncultured Gammaproteobacteria bacterium]|nr:hypothetical protein [uncultured Gammaproteobacteria bacterium]CAC9986710.1 hypothetical protein [uncultured Gammaproteobacteria bacterium]
MGKNWILPITFILYKDLNNIIVVYSYLLRGGNIWISISLHCTSGLAG